MYARYVTVCVVCAIWVTDRSERARRRVHKKLRKEAINTIVSVCPSFYLSARDKSTRTRRIFRFSFGDIYWPLSTELTYCSNRKLTGLRTGRSSYTNDEISPFMSKWKKYSYMSSQGGISMTDIYSKNTRTLRTFDIQVTAFNGLRYANLI